MLFLRRHENWLKEKWKAEEEKEKNLERKSKRCAGVQQERKWKQNILISDRLKMSRCKVGEGHGQGRGQTVCCIMCVYFSHTRAAYLDNVQQLSLALLLLLLLFLFLFLRTACHILRRPWPYYITRTLLIHNFTINSQFFTLHFTRVLLFFNFWRQLRLPRIVAAFVVVVVVAKMPLVAA